MGLVAGHSVNASVHKDKGYDGGNKVKGRTRHVLVDTLGWLLIVIVTKADSSDQAGLKRILAALTGKLARLTLIKADEGYRGKVFSWVVRTYQRVRTTVKREEAKGFQVLPQRWGVARTRAWPGNYRRSSKDCEALPQTSATFSVWLGSTS